MKHIHGLCSKFDVEFGCESYRNRFDFLMDHMLHAFANLDEWCFDCYMHLVSLLHIEVNK